MEKKVWFNAKKDKFFNESMANVKKINQNVFYLFNNKSKKTSTRLLHELNNSYHYFSSDATNLNNRKHDQYIRKGTHTSELKKLKRGDYAPEMFFDLHGMNQYQSKRELGQLIFNCRRNNISCVCLIHGHGKHILKNQVPFWLAKHPHIVAFYPVKKKYGPNISLLILIDTK